MAERKFADGDRVVHKSGGPVMTVVGYGKYGSAATKETYKCRWFDSKGEIREATFIEAELEPAPAPSSGSVRVQRG